MRLWQLQAGIIAAMAMVFFVLAHAPRVGAVGSVQSKCANLAADADDIARGACAEFSDR